MKRTIFCRGPLLLALALGITIPAPGQETNAGALTLAVAIRCALTNNPDLRVLAADITAARGEVITAKTWSNPEISVTPGFVRSRDPASTEFHGDFGLEQTIEWPGKRALRRAVAEKNVALRQLALTGFQSQLAIQVRRHWAVLLLTRDIIALREQQLTLAESFVEAAKKKVEAGVASDFETTKAEVEVVTAQKSLRDVRAQRDATLVTLNALLGQKPAEPLIIADSANEDAALPGQFSLFESALSQNPALKIQEAEAERAGLSLQAIRKSRLPDFKIGPGVEYTRDEQTVGIGLSLPLPFWDRKHGEVTTANAEQQKALAELDKLRRDLLSDIMLAWQNLIAAQESLAFHTPALRDKLKAALAAATQGYAEGRTPLWLYLEAQRTYFDTQADYFDARQKLLETQAGLESAVGVPLDSLSQPH